MAVSAAVQRSAQTATQVTQPLMDLCMRAKLVQVQEVQEVQEAEKAPMHLRHLRRHRLGTEVLAGMAAAVLVPEVHPSSRIVCQRVYPGEV